MKARLDPKTLLSTRKVLASWTNMNDLMLFRDRKNMNEDEVFKGKLKLMFVNTKIKGKHTHAMDIGQIIIS